jgi:hypothetical protein
VEQRLETARHGRHGMESGHLGLSPTVQEAKHSSPPPPLSSLHDGADVLT